jgi:hypothetical protein
LLVLGGLLVLIPVVLAFGNGLLSPRALVSVMIAYAACVAVAAFAEKAEPTVGLAFLNYFLHHTRILNLCFVMSPS